VTLGTAEGEADGQSYEAQKQSNHRSHGNTRLVSLAMWIGFVVDSGVPPRFLFSPIAVGSPCWQAAGRLWRAARRSATLRRDTGGRAALQQRRFSVEVIDMTEDEKGEESMVENFFDSAGKKRTFRLGVYAAGNFFEAVELREGEPSGIRSAGVANCYDALQEGYQTVDVPDVLDCRSKCSEWH